MLLINKGVFKNKQRHYSVRNRNIR